MKTTKGKATVGILNELADKEGLKSFLQEEFVCTWEGFAVWDAGSGTVDCHYEAQIKLQPTEMILQDEALAKQLAKHPRMSKEAIYELFASRLQKYLDYEFEEYCTADDYYQPVVEDFGSEITYGLPSWCEKNGFTFVSFEGNGDDEGYEQKYSRRW